MGDLTTRKIGQNPDNAPKRGKSGKLQAGTLLQDRYRVLGTLGIGGFSAVYQARDMHFPAVTRLCAIKEMVHLNRDPEVRQLATTSFEREASILATLSHPAVPDVYDFFTEDDRSYLVLEYIRGKTLETLLVETDDHFAVADVFEWMLQLCDVLAYLHSHEPQPVVFRDLKPSNVMLDPNGRVRLIDFNIAKSFRTGIKGTMIGTEGYSPPEQYRGEASPAGDVYALGATMHHLLTGRDPRMEAPFSFAERPVRASNSDVPPALESLVERCLSYNVANRYQDARELREALLNIASEIPNYRGEAVSPSPSPSTSSTLRAQGGSGALSRSHSVEPLWRFKCEDEIRSTAAVDNGTIYVGAYDHNLYALESGSGKFLWKYATEAPIGSSPCVTNDHVLIGSADEQLYAIKRRDGKLDWCFQSGGPIYSSPRVELGHVFFGSDDGYLYAVSVSSGRRVWRAPGHSKIRSTPFLHEEQIYFGTEGGYVFCVDLGGQLKWQFQARRAVTSSPTVAEEMVLVGAMDSTVYALDANSGWAIWRFRGRRPIVSSPTVGEETVYIGSSDGHLYALELFSGRKRWDFEVEGQINSKPMVWEDGVYFSATNGALYCLDAKRGKERWRYQTGDVMVASPTIIDGVVYVGSCDHYLYALPA